MVLYGSLKLKRYYRLRVPLLYQATIGLRFCFAQGLKFRVQGLGCLFTGFGPRFRSLRALESRHRALSMLFPFVAGVLRRLVVGKRMRLELFQVLRIMARRSLPRNP